MVVTKKIAEFNIRILILVLLFSCTKKSRSFENGKTVTDLTFNIGDKSSEVSRKILNEPEFKLVSERPGIAGRFIHDVYTYGEFLIYLKYQFINNELVLNEIYVGFKKKMDNKIYFFFKALDNFNINTFQRGSFFYKLSDDENHTPDVQILIDSDAIINLQALKFNAIDIDFFKKSNNIQEINQYVSDKILKLNNNQTNLPVIFCTYLKFNLIYITSNPFILFENNIIYIPSNDECAKLFSTKIFP